MDGAYTPRNWGRIAVMLWRRGNRPHWRQDRTSDRPRRPNSLSGHDVRPLGGRLHSLASP
jgi:hypothetical protein